MWHCTQTEYNSTVSSTTQGGSWHYGYGGSFTGGALSPRPLSGREPNISCYCPQNTLYYVKLCCARRRSPPRRAASVRWRTSRQVQALLATTQNQACVCVRGFAATRSEASQRAQREDDDVGDLVEHLPSHGMSRPYRARDGEGELVALAHVGDVVLSLIHI